MKELERRKDKYVYMLCKRSYLIESKCEYTKKCCTNKTTGGHEEDVQAIIVRTVVVIMMHRRVH